MTCPTCKQPLHKQTIDDQQIWHCPNCGSTFFDENSINRITIASSEKLLQDKRETFEAPSILSCPRDKIFFLPMEADSIPRNVRLFQCPQCKGIFASPQDLVDFKKAQDAKINYFKLWQIPLPNLQAVIVLSLAVFLVLSAVITTFSLRKPTLTSSQASGIIENLSISSANRYMFVTFRTSIPVTSKIILRSSTGEWIEKQISQHPSIVHQFVSGDILFQDQSKPATYQIVLTDSHGNSSTTEPQILKLTQ